MYRVKVVAVAAIVAVGVLVRFATPGSAQAVTAFEGARLIVGDGRMIEHATLVVDETTIAQAGATADVRVPAGATRVSLVGKTVMPMLIDTHTHLGAARDAIVRDLRLRAYYGVSAALSLGTDSYEVLDMRGQAIPGAARFFSAGRGITMPEPGRTTVPYWITTEAEARKAVEELAAHRVDIVKIWVDTRDGKYKKLTPELYGAIIDEAHKRGLRVTAHIYDLEDAKGLIRAGIDAFAHGVRDREVDDELLAMFRQRPSLVVTPNLPDRGVKVDLGWLRAGLPADEHAKLEAANTDRPAAQAAYGLQARNLAKLYAAGVRLT
ncbi:MAG: amidohydrolase family protein, partial [Candidatus Rokuibacteriota bacterium]